MTKRNKCVTSRWQKFVAVSIIALLSTGLDFLMHFLSGLMREKVIEEKNLRGIIDEIQRSNVDIRTLSNVLRDPPPPFTIYIVILIGTAITVWLYHRILSLICKRNDQNNL